jgi:hypothetical protein
MEIPDGSTVVAPTLLSFTRGYAAVVADDWSNYVKYKTGTSVQFADKKCKSVVQCYMLVFRQELNSDNQFIVLKKIKQSGLLVSSMLTIYSMPPQANAVIIGSFIPGEVAPKLEINGASVVNVGAGLFSSNFPHDSDDGFVQTARVTGNVDINPEQITISHYSAVPRLRSLSAELADGIDFKKQNYPDFLVEVLGMSGNESEHRWTEGKNVIFTFKQNLPANFILELDLNGAFGPNVGKEVQVQIGDWKGRFIAVANPVSNKLIVKTTEPTDSIELIIPEPKSPKSLGQGEDARQLGLAIKRIGIVAI